ncbi:MAG: patatin-like phospholipase family protein [Acidobacteria bacterium]|nr:patatin-like phospholipase family protein [Acidobacteriota bacterium]
MPTVRYKWVFDTGGAGRGAWIGGIGHALTKAAQAAGIYPDVVIGSSVGAYMAADAASGDPQVFIKGWSDWGAESVPPPAVSPIEQGFWKARHFRAHLKHSIEYVLDDVMIQRILSEDNPTRLIVCTTQISKRNGEPINRRDMRRLFLQSLMRKWPVKCIFAEYMYRAVLFDSRAKTSTPVIKKLTPENLREAIMASCLIPLAMGTPLRYDALDLIDAGFTLKMPLYLPSDAIYADLAREIEADKTLAISVEPDGRLWETTMRLHQWNDRWDVQQAMREGKLLVISPPREIAAGMLCRDNRTIMKIFWEGAEYAEQVLRSEAGKRFFELLPLRLHLVHCCGATMNKVERIERTGAK